MIRCIIQMDCHAAFAGIAENSPAAPCWVSGENRRSGLPQSEKWSYKLISYFDKRFTFDEIFCDTSPRGLDF